ncbi:MAG: flagellar basal body P-ring formation chaperone FlgA [Alphaproteobacteria bacterium]
MSRLLHYGLWAALMALMPNPVLGGEIALNAQVKIDRAAIRLADVFSGLAPTQDLEIATAPEPGRGVVYDYGVLSKLAQRYNLDWRANSFTDKSVITRASHKIDTAMIKAAIVDQLKAQGVQGDIDVAFDNRSLEINLPTEVNPDFSLQDFAFDKTNQRFRAELLAAADTPAFQQMHVTGRAVNTVDVPVLNKTMAQGDVIEDADLDWIKMTADRAGDYMRGSETVVGMELKRQMPAQSPIRIRDIASPRVVLRGSLVTMKIESPAMLLTSQGRALQDGAVGEVIRVTNTQSNRVIEAKIVSPGVVKIEMPVQLATN